MRVFGRECCGGIFVHIIAQIFGLEFYTHTNRYDRGMLLYSVLVHPPHDATRIRKIFVDIHESYGSGFNVLSQLLGYIHTPKHDSYKQSVKINCLPIPPPHR